MSLIHQALKKVEAVKTGYARADDIAAAAPRKGASGFVLVMAAALALGAVTVVASHYLGSGPGTPEKAIPAGEAAGARPPAGPSIKDAVERNREGAYLYRTGRLQEAEASFLDAIGLDPGNGEYHNNLGLVYAAMGDQSRAEGSYARAIELDPVFPEAYNNYGSLLDGRGEHAGAGALFEKAASLDPSYADARLNMAISLERQGRINDALVHYDRFMSLNRDPALAGEVERKVMRLKSRLSDPGGGRPG
jgi:tetratricopeptide (TPR) repeat protein